MKEEYMKKKDFAEYLKVSLPTVDRAMKSGLPYCKVGGAVRIPLNAAVLWMNKRARDGGK